MKVDFFHTPNVFEQLASEWNALVSRSSAKTVFATWEWNTHWWHAYHPGELWVITFRDEQQRLVGIAPWFIETHPERGRQVHFIGCEDVTDYLDLIVDAAAQDAVLACLAETLQSCRDHYDGLDLCNIPNASPTLQHFTRYLEHMGFTTRIQQQEVCPVIQLPATFEQYLETVLDSKNRGELRRKLRRAEGYNGNLGTLAWYIVNASHNLDEEAEKFMRLMALSHPDKAAFLTNEQHVTFFKRIIPAALRQGWLQLNFLVVDGEPAAAYFNFDYNNHILVYNSGLNPKKHADLSPGIVLLAYNIQHAIAQQRTAFDFLRGDEQYKYRMGAKDTAVFNLQAQIA